MANPTDPSLTPSPQNSPDLSSEKSENLALLREWMGQIRGLKASGLLQAKPGPIEILEPKPQEK